MQYVYLDTPVITPFLENNMEWILRKYETHQHFKTHLEVSPGIIMTKPKTCSEGQKTT